MIIYKATNRINNKSYIGQTQFSFEKRKKQHIHDALNKRDNMYFHKAIRKYDPDSFEWEILHDNINSIDFLNRLEIFYIGYYNTFENGYNLTKGGLGHRRGYKCTKETKKKLSNAIKRRTIEVSIKIAKAMSKRSLGKNNPMYGKRGANAPSARNIILIHPDGEEEFFDCIKFANIKYNLTAGSLGRVAKGEYTQHKGYKCRYAS